MGEAVFGQADLMLTLDRLLKEGGLDPTRTIVMRHRPKEPKLRRVFSGIARTRPDLFDAYQRTQYSRAGSSLSRKTHLVSCIGEEPGQALLVGVFAVAGQRPSSHSVETTSPEFRELVALGLEGEADLREKVIRIDLRQLASFRDYDLRLVLGWPGLERSWFRLAHRNVFPILSYLTAAQRDPAMPNWRDLVFTFAELKTLPDTWKAALRQWRGIYLIFDTESRGSYVGSAGGGENILGRWLNYAATGHGGNKRLRGLAPATLRFSILERVSPDMAPADLVALESAWKLRLHSREFGLNAN